MEGRKTIVSPERGNYIRRGGKVKEVLFSELWKDEIKDPFLGPRGEENQLKTWPLNQLPCISSGTTC
jgi:hypothetical protein